MLLEALWGSADYRDPRTIDVHVRHLREKLEADPRDARVHPHGARRRLPLPRPVNPLRSVGGTARARAARRRRRARSRSSTCRRAVLPELARRQPPTTCAQRSRTIAAHKREPERSGRGRPERDLDRGRGAAGGERARVVVVLAAPAGVVEPVADSNGGHRSATSSTTRWSRVPRVAAAIARARTVDARRRDATPRRPYPLDGRHGRARCRRRSHDDRSVGRRSSARRVLSPAALATVVRASLLGYALATLFARRIRRLERGRRADRGRPLRRADRRPRPRRARRSSRARSSACACGSPRSTARAASSSPTPRTSCGRRSSRSAGFLELLDERSSTTRRATSSWPRCATR